MLDNSAGFFSEVWGWGLEGYLAETAWSLLDEGPIGPSTISELMVAAPRSYSFIDFIVLADGRRYVRVWDASPYPSLALYVDGLRRQQDKMGYNPRQRLNTSNAAFFGWSAGGLTPYQGSVVEYTEITRALAEGERPDQVGDLLDDLSRRFRFSVSELAKDVPRMTAAFDAEGEPLDDADAPFEDDFFIPFFNALEPDRSVQDSVGEDI